MEGVASNEVVVCEDDQTDGSTSQPVYVQLSDGEAFIQGKDFDKYGVHSSRLQI